MSSYADEEEPFDDTEGLNLLWDIMNHYDTIKAQKQAKLESAAEKTPGLDLDQSPTTHSHSLQPDKQNSAPATSGQDPQPDENTSAPINISDTTSHDSSLLQEGYKKEDGIDADKERATKQKVGNYWKKELELKEPDQQQLFNGQCLSDKQ